MWIAVTLIAILTLSGLAAITGIGVYDSRDTRYSLRIDAGPVTQRLYENLVAPGRRRLRAPKDREGIRAPII